jgi:hypothetical protein
MENIYRESSKIINYLAQSANPNPGATVVHNLKFKNKL